MASNKRDSAAELAAVRQRFPKPGAPAAIYQAASILVINGYLVHLVASGQSSPVGIAVFNIGELIVLSVIAHLALIGVPKQARLGDDGNSNPLQKIVVIALSLVWLSGIYYVSISFDTVHIQRLREARGVYKALDGLHILWPLLLSAVACAAATFADRLRWRRRGGIFVPEYAMSAAPKILTLVIAPIPAVLISESFLKNNLASALLAWSLVYLGIKAAFELLILAWQYFGMPEAKPRADSPTR